MLDLVPIRVTKIGTPGDDDAPQALIAYERQIAGVGNLLLPLLMARCATYSEDVLSVFDIAYRGRRIGRHVCRTVVLLIPASAHACNEHVNLLWSKETAGRLSKGRHLCSRHPGHDPAPQ